MTSAAERMSTLPAVLQPTSGPRPGSLAARALAAPPPIPTPTTSAPAAMLPAQRGLPHAPPRIDNARWYGRHAKLANRLLHMAVRAAALPPGPQDNEVDEALAALLLHAREIVNYEPPEILAKDGVHTIPHAKLASARAKVSALRLELVRTRAELAALKGAGGAAP
ncbi:hypothetical protein [Acidovorax sp. LjRoot117]|uniref:hypothetical protein n=1 Tax=Acidovorax sp. LjRoot117 TaxID=3342255 RepID=UPI003ECF24DB